MFGNLIVRHPDAVLLIMQTFELIRLARRGVVRIQDGCVVQLQISQINLLIRINVTQDIDGQYRGYDTAGDNSDHNQRSKHTADIGKRVFNGTAGSSFFMRSH